MMRIFLLLLTLCAAAPALAQDADDGQLSREAITNWTNEPLFPQAIRFTLSTTLAPEDIRDLTLTVEQPGRFSDTVNVDLTAASAASDPFSQFAYIWAVPADNPPLVFADINFSWRFTDAAGTVFGVRDRLFFTDARVEWDISSDDLFQLITVADGANLSRVRRDAAPLVDLLRADLGESYRIVFLSDPTLLECPRDAADEIIPLEARSGETFTCDPALLEQIYAANDLTILPIPADTSAEALDVLVSFMIDEVFGARWDAAGVPLWFRSGFKQFFTPSLKTDLLPPVIDAARTRATFSLAQLATPPTNPRHKSLWQAQSFSLVLYIASRIGVDELLEFGRALGGAASFETAYEQIVGQPLTALPRTWERWLFTREAELAYGYIPYGADTPTPTFTQTVTQTPTITLSPTLTRTPTRTPTPIPTRTPTRTPTVTPRPAGSLIVATPVLSPTPSATPIPVEPLIAFTPQTQALVIVVLLLMLGGLAYLYVRLGKQS